MGSWVEHPNVEVYDGLNLSKLGVDKAYLKLTSTANKTLFLHSLSEDCYDCPYTLLSSIQPESAAYLTIDTKHNINFQLLEFPTSLTKPSKENNSALCDVRTIGSASSMGEFGVYELNVNGSYPDSLSCYIHTLVEPVNIYLSLLLIILIIIGGVLACTLFSKVLDYLREHSSLAQRFIKPKNKQSEVQIENGSAGRKRVKSLDTFRGISIVVMIFVNDGAGGYWFMEHATWNGLQVADLLFPWFMWIMGVCIPISIRGTLKRAVPVKSVMINIFRRSLTMFILGLMLNTAYNGADMDKIRIFGVLQRFGIAYFFVASIAFLLAPSNGYQPTKKEDIEENVTFEVKKSTIQRLLDKIPEVICLKLQWCVMLLLVAVHLLIIFLLEVPGCPTGYLGPGGIENGGHAKGCAGGATGYIDESILGINHIYQNPTSRQVYQGGPFDPEGPFGCLLSIFQVFLGLQAGVILLLYGSHKDRLARWLIWTAITGAIGAILCLCSKEEGWIPVNKNLWSLSFVMVTTCFAFALLSICYYFVDMKGIWSGSPFYFPGMNAIVMYVGHSLGFHHFPWHWSIPGAMNTHFVLTIEALWGTGLWVMIAGILYRKKTFITI